VRTYCIRAIVAALAGLLVVPAGAEAAAREVSGRPQSVPDRNTRGYFTSAGTRVWLDVFPNVTVP
jgi:hypothetical protein